MTKNMLTKNKILKGMRYTQDIVLASYGGAIVKIHAVSDVTMSTIQEEMEYSIFEAIEGLEGMGLDEKEIESLINRKSVVDPKKLAVAKFPPKLFRFMAELCREGIVPEPDPECPKCHGKKSTKVCEECDIRKLVDDIRGFATIEIGAAILGASTGNWKDVEAFFTAPKGQSGAESSAPTPSAQ